MIDTAALGELEVVAAYLVRGRESALIDMGYRSSAESVIKDLEAWGFGSKDLDYLLPTHVHLDHCGSCGSLAKFYSRAIVGVHPRGQPHLSDPTRLIEGATALFGKERMAKYGLPDPVSAHRIRNVSDDDTIDLGDKTTLRAIWTPGHAPHHLSYFEESSQALFTGDAVGVEYPAYPQLVPTTPPPSFNFEKAVDSLARIHALSPKRLFTPHFGVREDAEANLERYLNALAHWRSKFEKLLSLNSSPDEIIALIMSETKGQRPNSELPDYLKVTITLSVRGFFEYMKWKGSA